MPSYPTSVWVPTTKATGDTLQAAHVNDAQDEIVAIEGGIRNGTAPVNSSNSTVANLSVTGGSTFAGAVVMPRRPSVEVTHSTIQGIANDAHTVLSWDTESYDSTALHSTATNPSRITLTSSGLWSLGASIDWNQNSSGFRTMRLLLNGTTLLNVATQNASTATAGGQTLTAQRQTASTTDYVEVQGYQNSGSTASISSGGGNFGMSKFWAIRVSD